MRVFMAEIMIYIVASDAYGNAMAPLPVTTIYASNAPSQTLEQAFQKIDELEKRIKRLEDQKSVAKTKSSDEALFAQSTLRFDNVKNIFRTVDSNPIPQAADVAIINNKFLYQLKNDNTINSFEISTFEIQSSSAFGIDQFTATIQDQNNSEHYIKIIETSDFFLNQLKKEFEKHNKTEK